MNKLEETNKTIDIVTELKENHIPIDNTIFLADIAKSLAMIADKLCDAKEQEDGNDD